MAGCSYAFELQLTAYADHIAMVVSEVLIRPFERLGRTSASVCSKMVSSSDDGQQVMFRQE